MAKAVEVVAVRVLDCQGSGSNSQVIDGIDWVTNDHAADAPAVANMSLGGGASTALDDAVSSSIADGVTYAVAAGNESRDACNGSPARVPEAITAGSSTVDDGRSSFSNFGSCLDLFAAVSDGLVSSATAGVLSDPGKGTPNLLLHTAGG